MMFEVAGNCFGKRMALDNLHATEMRKANDEAGLKIALGRWLHVAARAHVPWLFLLVKNMLFNIYIYSHHIAMVF